MPLNFTFALSQQQTFELRCDYGSRRLDKTELGKLIDLCEQNYYSQQKDSLPDLKQLGWRLYQWLDGNEGWLRRALNDADEQTIYLDLIQTSEAQGLNPETERVALGLAHLPWELLHNGAGFLLERQNLSVLPVRCVQQRQTQVIGVQNRPLRLLFMATSPEDPRVPLLGFEQEEANILQATKDQPLALIVEESGSVAELANLVQSYQEDYFDVFHLTGHGIIYTQQGYGYLLPTGTKLPDNTPCFITEDEVGNMQLTTVKDLARAFRGRWPRVIFLSGCHTGQVANKGTVPSMAQALVKAGAGIVLGWARPVFDTTGIVAAQALYQALATGATVEEAVKAAQREMIDRECTDWHLLRIYRDTRPINQLVTALRTRDRERLTFTAPEQEFLDENNQVKVASRFEFVGRRRPLQGCLKALGETSDQIGVFIAGMGGLGKSTLAARLCTRVQMQRDNFARVVLIGPLDEIGLLNKLSNKYERFADVPALLNKPKVSLKGRLQNFFEAIEKQHKQPLLLVLDDFEQNIPIANVEDGSLRMTAEAYEILRVICAALADNSAESRLIVTCRYLKADTLPPHRLHLESLAGMSSSDIDKICFPLDKDVRQQLRTQRIIHIADGNPRLLKWLLEVIQQPGIAADELLNRLEATEQKFREDILAQTLLDALELEEQKFLARLSVFNLPVTVEIINAISPSVASLQKLVSLSLVESATTHPTQPDNYRVTTILESLLETVLIQEEWQATRQQAVRKIHQVWWEESNQKTEAQGLEIVRLGLLTKEQEIAVSIGDRIANNWANKSRFVEAFDLCEQILAVYQDYRILRVIAYAEKVLGSVEEAVVHCQQALDLCPQEDLQEKASILHNMAGLKARQGDKQGAIALYEQSLQITKDINDVRGQAAALYAIGELKAQEGDIQGAIASYKQSLQITEDINHVRGQAATLDAMARIIAQQGDIPKAIALWEQVLEIQQQIDDPQNKAGILSNLAFQIAQQGDIARASAFWEQSLEIFEQIGDVGGKAATLNNMAGEIAQQGDIARASALWEQSLEIFEQIGDVGGKAATLRNMAGEIAQQGDIPRANALYEQSLEIFEQIGDIGGKATTLNNMAGVIAQQGDIPRANALYEQSLEIFEQIGDVRGKAASLNNMAGEIAQQGDIARASALYEQSLEIFEQIGDVRGKAASLNNMAGEIAQQGDIVRAIALYEQSLEIFEQIGDVRGKAASLNNMAGEIAQQGDIVRAIALWEQSLEIKEQIGDVQGKATTLENMAGVIAQEGDIPKAITLWEQSLEIFEQIGDVRGKAATLRKMAGVIAQQGDIPKAIALYEQSLEITEQIGDVQRKATTLNNMAMVFAQQGDIPRAIALWEQSLEIFEQIKDVQGKALTLTDMALVFAQQGDIDRAIALWEQFLEIFEQIADVQVKATTLNNMAGVIAQKGDIDRAIALYEQSLEITEQIGNVKGKATTLNNMAMVFAQQGDIPRAIALWEQSLEITEQIGNVKGKATTLNNMAMVFAQQGDIPRAIALWEQNLEISEQIGDVKGKATTLNNMAGVIADQGDIPKAIALWEQSLEIFEHIGDVKLKAITLNNMAGVFAQQGDIPKAIALWEQSLEISEQIGDVKNKATTLNNMGQIFAQQGDIPKAIALYKQSLEISEQIGDVQLKAATLSNMGLVFAQKRDIPRAIALWEQSLEIFEQIGDVQGKAATLSNMAGVFANQGDIPRAIALLKQAVATFAQISEYSNLVTVLGNLGVRDESNGLVYLAQAIWLTLRIQAPLVDTIELIHVLYNRVPQGDELKAVLGATAMFFCNRRGEDHPQLEELQEHSVEMISGAAGGQGIETEEAFQAWYIQQRLNDLDYFLPRLNQRLEEIVGDGWLFDRSQFEVKE